MKIFYRIRRLIFKLFPQLMKSKDYIEWLKANDVEVGKGTYFFSPCTTTVDVQRPWLLHIGAYCKVTSGVTILCHDYSRSVLRRSYGDIVGEARRTYIGDNVFIGMNSTVLMGANIGNNVIVGAGSVVSGKIPNNTVVAGNPAKIICGLDEYYKKRKSKMLDESFDYFWCFYKKYKRYPQISEMGPFFPIFLERDRNALKENAVFTNLSGDNEEEIIDNFISSTGFYDNYDEYIIAACKHKTQYCNEEEKIDNEISEN